MITETHSPKSSNMQFANNIDRYAIDLVRPHVLSGKCLIVTGFVDMLSSLSIIMDILGPILRDTSILPRPQIRLVYGIDSANQRQFRKDCSVKESITRYYMRHHNLKLENTSDLKAIMAIKAIERGEIDIHVFDRELAKQRLGWRGGGKMHAKIISSDLGVVHGSANFSQSGLNYNIEWNEDIRYDVDCIDATKIAKSCAEFAENIFSVSIDCNEEVLKILRNLLRTTSPEDAVSRCIAEQTGFIHWQADLFDNQGLASEKKLFPFQSDLVYQAAGAIYDHGVAFVCAPAGSGKTPVGKYLAYILSETHRKAISDGSMPPMVPRGAVVISPSRIKRRWKNDGKYKVLSYTDLSNKNHDQGMKSPAVHIVDESHQLAPGLKSVSNRSRKMEDAPPAWTIFLSATQLGNRDVDSLIHFQEKRASLFIPDRFVKDIQDLSSESLNLFHQVDDSFNVILDPLNYDDRLDQIREKLCEIISPYVVLCTRDNVGSRTEKTSGKCGLYPKIYNHKRHQSLRFNHGELRKIDQLVNQIACISGDRPKIVQKFSRFGELDSQMFRESALHARNLISLFRVSPVVARYEMTYGTTGESLRKIEKQKNMSKPILPGQLELFPEVKENVLDPTPECDKLTTLLQSRVIDGLHQKCLNALLSIKKSHPKVVFLAERVLPLLVYAELLGQSNSNDEVYVIASDKDASKSIQHDSFNAILGHVEKSSYIHKTDGKVIEDLFSEEGKKRTSKSVSIFMTYQMAEGVNMQTCDTLVCLGVASSMTHIIQGLGRIDRINSPFNHIHYYLVDLPTVPLRSDQNAKKD